MARRYRITKQQRREARERARRRERRQWVDAGWPLTLINPYIANPYFFPNLTRKIVEFYLQEPLGAEFERVIAENLPELYES